MELVTKTQKGISPKVTVRNKQAEFLKKVGGAMLSPIKKFKENQEKMAKESTPFYKTRQREATRAKFRK